MQTIDIPAKKKNKLRLHTCGAREYTIHEYAYSYMARRFHERSNTRGREACPKVMRPHDECPYTLNCP